MTARLLPIGVITLATTARLLPVGAVQLAGTGAPTGPTINTQPGNQSVTEPATATFTVSATASAGSLTYQWQRQPSGGGGYSNISGAVSASYTTGATTVTGGSHNNGDTYRCNVTDTNGTTTTNAATLTVAAPLAGFDLNSSTYAFKANSPPTLWASIALTIFVHDATTGALVALITGYSTNASGIVTTKVVHASIVAGTLYSVSIDGPGGTEYGRIKLTAS